MPKGFLLILPSCCLMRVTGNLSHALATLNPGCLKVLTLTSNSQPQTHSLKLSQPRTHSLELTETLLDVHGIILWLILSKIELIREKLAFFMPISEEEPLRDILILFGITSKPSISLLSELSCRRFAAQAVCGQSGKRHWGRWQGAA